MYIALYRKKRPKNFYDVVGQEAIVTTLLHQLQQNRITHAYLFTGTRGTGKTTMAKILARAVNCLSPQDGEPCNVCENCQLILEDRMVDVVEIDAASNNGVDNIRDIREETRYPPTMAKMKVYIIDEVHMLSTGAFNALLKILEEPPSYVMFILATTDPHKIPATVLSRCQRFDFRRISAADIQKTLMGYLDEDGHVYEENAISLISYMAEGSMRDGISMLDQCISFFSQDVITEELVRLMLGAVDTEVLFTFVEALYQKDQEKTLAILQRILDDGRDLTLFTNDIILHIRNILVAQITKDDSLALEYSKEYKQQIQQQGNTIPKDTLLFYIDVLSQAENHMRFANNVRILLEVAVFKIMHTDVENLNTGLSTSQSTKMPATTPETNETSKTIEILFSRLEQQERLLRTLLNNPTKISTQSSAQPNATTASRAEDKDKVVKKQPILKEYEQIIREWPTLKVSLGTANMKFLTRTRMTFLNNTLFLICENNVILTALKNKEPEIIDTLEEKYKRKLTISMTTEEIYKEKYGTSHISDLDELEAWIDQ